MKKQFTQFTSFVKEDDAPAMAEYALLLGLIAVVVIVTAVFLGERISDAFNLVGSSL